MLAHNASKYDFKPILIALCELGYDVDVIPCSKENYIGMMIKVPIDSTGCKSQRFLKIIFKDTYRFYNSSLAKWVKTLNKSRDFIFTRKYLASENCFMSGANIESMLSKQCFPYSYLSLVKFIIKSKIKGDAKVALGECGLENLPALRTFPMTQIAAQETSRALRETLTHTRQGWKTNKDYGGRRLCQWWHKLQLKTAFRWTHWRNLKRECTRRLSCSATYQGQRRLTHLWQKLKRQGLIMAFW